MYIHINQKLKVMKFKSLDEMNEFMSKYDPFEIGEGEEDKTYLNVINKHIKKDIVDKGKILTPSKLNSLLMRLEMKYDWV
jgi:hypothetical protein